MIKYAELRYFRKHEDLRVEFSTGLNVLRGPNEIGKTTLLEGVCFAMLGTAALRDTLAETVTWGHKESEMKTKVIIAAGGVDYTFTRSKGGAECNYEGGKVTGQKEVTAFASQLLGVDPKTANALIMASQSDLRGALDSGPTAVSALMAKLADFDLIDRLVARAKKTLSLGSEAPVRARLETARTELAAAEENPPSEAGISFYDSLIAGSEASAEASRTLLANVLQPNLQEAQAALDAAVQGKAKHDGVRQDISMAESQIANVQHRITLVTPAASVVIDPDYWAMMDKKIQDGRRVQVRLSQYRLVKALGTHPDLCWDQNEESFNAELQAQRVIEANYIGKMSAAQKAAADTRRRKITNGKCPTCGHAAHGDDHVAKHNQEVENEAKVFDQEYNTLVAEKAKVSDYISTLVNLQSTAQPFKRAAQQLATSEDVKIDLSIFPPRIEWIGEEPVAVDVAALEAQVADARRKEQAAQQAKGQLAELERSLAGLNEARSARVKWVQENACPDVQSAVAARNAAADAYNAEATRMQEAQNEAGQYRLSQSQAKAAYEAAMARIETWRQQVVQCEADLTKLIFNNNLLTKLEKLKPAITDSLWQTVLAAVSNFFSNLRGEKSVVTKDSSGFKVNGRSVESLSGSTIDVLAIALRVALTKTFIPATSFITLDEPAHGCDAMRTGNVLGFLSSAGFQQILLASHDELSESVADKVVSLGT